MCQLDCLQVPELNIISGCDHVGVSGWISIWSGGLGKAHSPPQCWWASFNLSEAWIEQRAEEGRIYPAFASCLPAWAGTSVYSCPWTGIHAISNSGSQDFRSELNYKTGFSGFRICGWQIMGHFNFHSHMSQFLRINLAIYHLYLHSYIDLSPSIYISFI